MTILPIYITGEPILHRVADPVESFDSTLRDLVADMIETMHAAPGVGLAAPQVGVGLQLFVWSYRGGGAFDRRYKDILGLNDGAARSYNSAMSGVVVNPTLELVWDNDGVGAILPTQPDMTNESEGCLSVPGVQYPLRRALGAILRGYDADGTPSRRVLADGSLASSNTSTTTCAEPSTLIASIRPTVRTRARMWPSAAGGQADARGPRGSEPSSILPRSFYACVGQWTSKPNERK